MARISDGLYPDDSQVAMYLDRYAELMMLEPCGFNGVNKPTTNYDSQCVGIVGQSQRDSLAMYLLQAEQMREDELGFHVGHKWDSEQHEITGNNPFDLEWKHLVEVGYPTRTEIELAVALDHGTAPFSTANEPNDPVTIAVNVPTTVPNSEIRVYYPDEPDEMRRIYPSAFSRVGTALTISLPRCRLVKPEYNDDRDDPISYYDSDPFLETVDVYRFYADVSVGAEFAWIKANCADDDCVPNCQPACPMIIGPDAYRLSIVHVFPATYSAGAWMRSNCYTYNGLPDYLRITYVSGKTSMTDDIYTIRLAHTLMPRPPCSCDIVKGKWEEDNVVLDRQYSPYGSKRGQIDTWMHDSRRLLGNGGMVLGPVMNKYPA